MSRCLCGLMPLFPSLPNTGSGLRIENFTLAGGLKWQVHTAGYCDGYIYQGTPR